MRWLILMLAGAFILTGCSDTDEPPIDEPETSEADTEESVTEETETTETADEEDAESEEESDETASENTENESETEEVEEAAEPVDVMEGTELVSGYWINYSGEDDARSYMTRTEPMEYIPEQNYTVTAASYVSYFYGSEFIKTNNYGHDGPHIIEQVPEADRIIVSFNEPEKDTVQLINEGREDASAGNEVNTTPDNLVGRGKPVEEEMQGTIMFGQDFLSGDDVFTGERIDDKGNFVEDADYYVTGALKYTPSEDYVITSPAYISFYNGRRFIETVEITAVPAYLPEVSGANYINISFHDDYLFELNIIELD